MKSYKQHVNDLNALTILWLKEVSDVADDKSHGAALVGMSREALSRLALRHGVKFKRAHGCNNPKPTEPTPTPAPAPPPTPARMTMVDYAQLENKRLKDYKK